MLEKPIVIILIIASILVGSFFLEETESAQSIPKDPLYEKYLTGEVESISQNEARLGMKIEPHKLIIQPN